MKRMPPVAVVGMGCICAAGATIDPCMESLFAGHRNPQLPSRFTIPKGFTYPVFEVPDTFIRSGGPGSATQRTSLLAQCATEEALADAGLTSDDLATVKTGICIGTNVGGSLGNETLFADMQQNDTTHIMPADRFAMSNPTAHLMDRYGLNGPFQTVVNACSAGNDAIGIAAGWIDAGWCDLVLAGGADEMYQVTYVGFKSLFINSDAPCQPFDRHRKGLNLGEGAAVMLLASTRLCEAIDLTPRGYVLGYGAAADAHHFTHPLADGAGLRAAIRDAIQQSGISTDDVAFINAHGTGTHGNDKVESTVLTDLFPQRPFLSTKGYTGHTLGAAGPVEAVFTLACLQHRQIPKTIGFETPDPELPATPTTRNQSITGSVAVSETLGFGGSNSVLILGKGDRPS
ncbi:MAG: beta-ketoacyl-[acyl-carrier-protein] synthase family protein [Desulfobacteraceae bacterium]|jgi:3-oxoacyl-[acyl-carrier-protein] synthase-1/3-oxoacyl-[acyl-carrier-protein] synthase II